MFSSAYKHIGLFTIKKNSTDYWEYKQQQKQALQALLKKKKLPF